MLTVENQACPAAEDLVRMVEGGLGHDSIAGLERHIDVCESCRFAVSKLALGSTMRPTAPPSDHVGLASVDVEHYALGDEIARGGMGRIFRARDRRLGRDVAIKENFVRSGDAARFEREARITARLQHPSIVQVHDAGRWPTGEPFFAMQLVSGRSLHDAIAAAATLEERLALVPNALAVADAIAYAHSRGVIHRDLKPKNVIVGEFGETVVIDWGLAKDLSAPAADASDAGAGVSSDPGGHTELGTVIGTPAYMPPEQAHGEVVDRRADVYALGAILYHVLSGRPPVTGTARDAVLATIVEGSVTPLAAVQPGVPADLLAIVSKAMAFDRAARYADARELAQDLRRFQTGQLVGARRYTWPRLAARWLRRHRTAVTVAAAALVVLGVFGVVSLREIVGAKRVAESERAAAVENRGDAEDLLRFMLGDLHDKLQPLGKLDLLDAVATKAIAYYKRREAHATPNERHKLSVSLTNLGDVLVDEGHTAQALEQYRAALAITESQLARDPNSAVLQGSAALSHQRIGDVLVTQGDHAGALTEFRAELAIETDLAARNPDDAKQQRDLGLAHGKVAGVLDEMSRTSEAIAEQRAGLAISARLAATHPSMTADRDLALDHTALGTALVDHGEHADGVAEVRAAIAILESASARDPADAQTQATLAATKMVLGDVLAKGPDQAAAAAAYRAAIALGEQLLARDPANAGWRANLAYCRTKLATAEHRLGHDTAALDELKAALPIQVALAAEDPTQLDRQHDLVLTHRELGEISLARHDAPGAIRELAIALELATTLAGKEPNAIEYRWDVGGAQFTLGNAHLAAGDRRTAIADFRAALATRQAISSGAPTNTDFAIDLANTHAALGDALEPGDPAAALAEDRAALPVFEGLVAHDPPDSTGRRQVAELRATIDRLAARTGVTATIAP